MFIDQMIALGDALRQEGNVYSNEYWAISHSVRL